MSARAVESGASQTSSDPSGNEEPKVCTRAAWEDWGARLPGARAELSLEAWRSLLGRCGRNTWDEKARTGLGGCGFGGSHPQRWTTTPWNRWQHQLPRSGTSLKTPVETSTTRPLGIWHNGAPPIRSDNAVVFFGSRGPNKE